MSPTSRWKLEITHNNFKCTLHLSLKYSAHCIIFSKLFVERVISDAHGFPASPIHQPGQPLCEDDILFFFIVCVLHSSSFNVNIAARN